MFVVIKCIVESMNINIIYFVHSIKPDTDIST